MSTKDPKEMTPNFDRTDPDGADEYFMNCIRIGDLKNAMTCFDPEAIYIDKEGNTIRGSANIEKVVANLCSRQAVIEIHEHRNFPIGNDMIYRLDKWSMSATDPHGATVAVQGASAHMMRKSTDGIWLWLVDNPFAARFFAD